ncbi:hypothetical protein LABALGNA3A7_05430 [Dellaglioa algida]|nr:hypothetical protein LABALGNA3A7_05430 [Dellaglioa algida]
MNKQERKVKNQEEYDLVKKAVIEVTVREDVVDLINIVNSSGLSYDECTKLKYELTRLINIEMKGGPVL